MTLDATWRAALAPPPRLSVAQWAERHLRLDRYTNTPGPYRCKHTPYVRGVYEAFRDPLVETIVLCWGAQTAKTTAEMTCAAYAVSEDPGPILWVHDTTDNGRSFSQDRWQTLVEDSKRLRKEKPDNPDRFKSMEMQFQRCTFTLVGSNSPGNLASRPVRYLFLDEVDKYPAQTTREGSAVSLAITRTRTYWNRKIVMSSTPTLTDGEIWGWFLAGDWREYWVPCPHCNAMQTLDFENIRQADPDNRDPETIRRTTAYVCPHCTRRIEDKHKADLIQAGRWVPRATPAPEYEWTPPKPGGRVISMHLPAWYSLNVRFGETLARFVAARHNPARLQEVINSDHARPWEERGLGASQNSVLAHRGEYRMGTPPPAAAIGAQYLAADVQADRLYYIVRAWGVAETSWLIDAGEIPSFQALETLLLRYRLDGALVDSGDGTRTAEIYTWCRAHPGVLPCKSQGHMRAAYAWTLLDKMPDGTKLDEGLRLFSYNADHYKAALFGRLATKAGDPGYWALPSDIPADYARQLTASTFVERKDTKGRSKRVLVQTRRDDHYQDCETIQLALADAMGLRNLKPEHCLTAAQRQPPEPPEPKPQPAAPAAQPIPKRSAWSLDRFG